MKKLLCFGLLLIAIYVVAAPGEGRAATNDAAAIPWSQIGAKAGADYNGDGLAVSPTESGARLHCVFQRLDGEATSQGLWLTSTASDTVSDRFRVTAMAVGRIADAALTRPAGHPLSIRWGEEWDEGQLPRAGSVSVRGQTVRFSRPGLTEEYSVSMDGVRQDFVVGQAPPSPSAGELVVKLSVSGAKVESAAYGARLVLAHSGRKIAYSRLRVTDATGKELAARIEVPSTGEKAMSLNSWGLFGDDFEEMSLLTPAAADGSLAVVVNDADAVYPVQIDPTFSDANWISVGGVPGAMSSDGEGVVWAAVVDASGNLFIGGSFDMTGGALTANIAQWNGSSWSALGSGISGAGESSDRPAVFALAVSGSTLYAGGEFTNAGGNAITSIAQWNGSTWSALGSGNSSTNADGYGPVVYALAVSVSTLYAGGDFGNVGGSAANNIAQWNRSSWSALGSGISGEVNALAVSGGTLYAGGYFTAAGGIAANYVAQWNGSSWSPLGSGISGVGWDGNGPDVSALAVSGNTLYACGDFTAAGGIAANYIAQWNGSSWSALGSGMGMYSYVTALAVSGSTLYAGGSFANAGGTAANCIAQWNANSQRWSALGSGTGGEVEALAVSGGTLYVGGGFGTAGSIVASNIVEWNGSTWSELGNWGISAAGINGFGPYIQALAVSGGTLYAGGDFENAGSNRCNSIAKWNGSSWSDLGLGLAGAGSGNGPIVDALAVSGSTLYVGGVFSVAGSTVASNIAQWDGSSWSALGSGTDGVVTTLAVAGTNLYVGGAFTTAGGSAANSIAQWNGRSWSALGTGFSGAGSYGLGPEVNALAVSGNTLYAGGIFTTAGNSAANNIAQWNGSSWSALGLGITNTGSGSSVLALAVAGSNLYVGGAFTTASGVSANNVARWNGSSWSALGSGIGITGSFSSVSALAVSGNNVYAGGYFSTAGDDTNANFIAQWDGSTWSAMGQGMNNLVKALVASDSTLYAGGDFTTAGTTVSFYVAEANLLSTTLTANPTNGVAPLTVNFTSSLNDSAGNTIVSWNWNFGDGATSANQNPSHVYNNVGTFQPSLVGTNSLGVTIYVLGPSIIVSPPTVTFTASPTNGEMPLTVQFRCPNVDSGGNTITQWNWAFGDGAISTNQNPTNVYATAGTYYPTLFATNSLGETVYGSGPSITVSTRRTVTFAASPTNGEAPLTVQFRCTNVDSGGNTITQWNWAFGDGAISTNQNPTNVYAIAGIYYPTLLATNSLGQTVYGSDAAVPLMVNTPDCTYEELVISMGPIAYYRLNELNGATAYDYFGGHNGTYQSAAIRGDPGVPDPPFFGFETNNLSVGITNSTANSWVFSPFGTLGVTNVTFTAWIYPVGVQNAWAGIIYDRTGDVGGVSYYGSSGMIGYTWGANNANTYNWASDLVPPANQWSFVAVTISPTKAVVYVYNTNTNAPHAATNGIAHTAVTTGNNWHIGNDAKADPGRTFNGLIDEVAIFPYSLTPTQISQLYNTAITAPQVTLAVTRSGQNVVITWPSGILQSAPTVTGPWTSTNSNSPYSFVPIGTQQYFRVKLQ